MAEYGYQDAAAGRPPSKVGRKDTEYMAAYEDEKENQISSREEKFGDALSAMGEGGLNEVTQGEMEFQELEDARRAYLEDKNDDTRHELGLMINKLVEPKEFHRNPLPPIISWSGYFSAIFSLMCHICGFIIFPK